MSVLLATIFWLVLKATLGIRLTREEEFEGLDIGEHAMEAYSGFVKQTDATKFIEAGSGSRGRRKSDVTSKPY